MKEIFQKHCLKKKKEREKIFCHLLEKKDRTGDNEYI